MNLLPFLVSGLGLGAVYALSGVGLSILFKASGTINFAFGAMGAVAAHLMWTLMGYGLPQSISMIAGVGAAAVIGLVYGLLIAPMLKDADSTIRSVATLGLTLILLGAMGLIWGEVPRRLLLATDGFSVSVFGARINGTRLAALAMTLLGVVGITAFLNMTRLGLAMRAVAHDRSLSAILGVATRRVDAIAWVMSATFAGLSGIFLANIVRLQPTFLTFLVIPAIAAAITGRLVSLPGAAMGGIVIGLLEAVLSAFPDVAPYRSVTPYIVALVFVAFLSPADTGKADA
jgi:branched-chain amino acid transport system permease protein